MKMTIREFCLGIQRAALAGATGRLGPRDELSADGEAIVELLEAIERTRRGIEIEYDRQEFVLHGFEKPQVIPATLDSFFGMMALLSGLFDEEENGPGMIALRKRLREIPNFAELLEVE